jgi:hypothetical protein
MSGTATSAPSARSDCRNKTAVGTVRLTGEAMGTSLLVLRTRTVRIVRLSTFGFCHCCLSGCPKSDTGGTHESDHAVASASAPQFSIRPLNPDLLQTGVQALLHFFFNLQE